MLQRQSGALSVWVGAVRVFQMRMLVSNELLQSQ